MCTERAILLLVSVLGSDSVREAMCQEHSAGASLSVPSLLTCEKAVRKLRVIALHVELKVLMSK